MIRFAFRLNRVAATLLLVGGLFHSAEARDWYINPLTGETGNEGTADSPLSLIQIAVDRAQPGDRIILLPEGALYRQSVTLNKRQSGLEIVGNGVTLSGAIPLEPKDWEDLGDGLRRIRLPRTQLDRHMLIINGKVQRMDRYCNQQAPFPAAEDLKEGEFRWDLDNETRGWLTYRGDVSNLEWAKRGNGFSTEGDVRNIKVFDLAARHFLNDGFNIHGNARGMQFFGITGHDNFDEGFGAHGTSVCWITASRFFGNENAISDQDEADTYYENCFFGASRFADVVFFGGRHSLINCNIVSSGESVPIKVRSGITPDSSDQGIAASLVLKNISVDVSKTSNPRVDVGPSVTLFVDSATRRNISGLEITKHPSSHISETLYRTNPIGRFADGTPIMAWVGGGAVAPRSGSYRIIHLDKHSPSDIAPKIAPDNDWFGLMSPLDTTDFPPSGKAFTPENSSAHAIWRWIALSAPDAVFVPNTPEGLALGQALQSHPPAGVGMVKVFMSQRLPEGQSKTTVMPTIREDISLAKSEMMKRLRRSPEEMAKQLSPHYGNDFGGSYIEALAIIARLDLGLHEDAEELAAAYLEKSTIPNSGGSIAGTLLYAALDQPWSDERVITIADLAFERNGKPLEAMPHHKEMSDAVFMACPVLAHAGRISGEQRYFDQCVNQLKFIQNLCLREDGIYRHSPINEAAWGRGNGFPALGLALALKQFPEDHPDRAFLIESLTSHLNALAPHQDSSGMWHQLIDLHDSYAELTSTCMIATSIAIAMRNGWIDSDEWSPRLLSAWEGVKTHVSSNGRTLLNSCTSTGKQKTLEDYYLREAILGHDPRGGAMALLLASEMKRWFDVR
ncbi:MAG: glycoside hydrolase family 88 protein [Verrucomicrobiales bacterium]|nr:glycoside hydrolase family 88 protein [Verrucomicrobiales bacterium]